MNFIRAFKTETIPIIAILKNFIPIYIYIYICNARKKHPTALNNNFDTIYLKINLATT